MSGNSPKDLTEMANGLFRGVMTKLSGWLRPSAVASARTPDQSDLPVTEHWDPALKGMQNWSAQRLVRHFADGQKQAYDAFDKAERDIVKAAILAFNVLSRTETGRITGAASGTPLRIMDADFAELLPTFSWPHNRVGVVRAGGEAARTRAIEGAEDDTEDAIRQVAELNIGPDDVFIAITSRGDTPFTVAAAKEAKSRGALVIGMSSVKDSEILKLADVPIFHDTGPESITGSTRMKAGTAQRMTMVTLTSTIMVLMKYVMDGYMIRVGALNNKLRVRQLRMIGNVTGCNREKAVQSYNRAIEALGRDHTSGLALAMLLAIDEPLGSAKALLEKNNGILPENFSVSVPK